MKRPNGTVPLNPDDPHSAVYLAARREWNERYGDYIAQANTWRLVALGCIAVSVVTVAGGVWDHQYNRPVPFIVEVNSLGDALPIARASLTTPADPRLIRAQLARWVADTRSVYTDVVAEKKLVNEAFTMVDRNAAAGSKLLDWYSSNDPFKKAADSTASIAVNSVLPLSDKTWRVEWCEDNRTRQGAPISTLAWQATITVAFNLPTSDAAIMANPTGLYVENFDWSQRAGTPCNMPRS